ncbi:MAG TPA: FkbM family methyltransferase [Vicinamibacterales bacterium]|nr:FkbM family methyltransferase [Vicinamibacterales bacterium]
MRDTIPAGVRVFGAALRLLPRGRYSLLAALGPTRGRFVARLAADLGSARFHCDLADDIARETCLTGYYEPPVTRVFQAHVRHGDVVVDAGANWGYFTLLAASLAGPAGRVLALEPDPRQFAALAANAALNPSAPITPHQAAASSEAGRLTLSGYRDDDRNRGVSRVGAARHDGPRFDVAAVTIDDLTASCPAVALVKIDVEGAEDLALAGMRRGLAEHRYRAVVLELHPELLEARGVDPAAVMEVLSGHGYRAAAIDLSPGAYRRAARPGVAVASLLRPADAWRSMRWPHLLWLC